MQVCNSLQDVFQVSIVSLIGSRMSEILVDSVHSGWDERGIEDAISAKTVLDDKKTYNHGHNILTHFDV